MKREAEAGTREKPMAIASCSVQVISRSSGRSSVAAAAYRSGETLYNEREGQTYSYARKTDRVYSEILAPSHAPEWVKNREQLWNQVEQIEKRKDSQLAREVMIALPKELSKEQNIALARAYAQTFANEGMVADLSIHDKGDSNPHAHIMLTTRPFNEDGTWGAKSKEAYMLDASGEKIRLKNGDYKSRKIPTTDWNTPEKLLEWRKLYEDITNAHLEKAGYSMRISVDSYEKQGMDKIPTVHMGHYVHSLERAGIETKVGTINRQIQAENREREALKQQLDATLVSLEDEQKQQEQLKQLEAQKREEARRQEFIRKHTISEEEAQKNFAEWVRQAKEALTQQAAQPEPMGWEALKQEAAKREEAWKRQEQEAREAEARRAFEQQQRRKFVRPSPFERPFRLVRPKRRRGVDWNTMAEALRARQEGHLDWQKLAERAETRRVDWQKLAEKQAERLDWKQLAEQAEAERVDWQKLAEQSQGSRTDWQKLTEEARKRDGGVAGFSGGEGKKPLRDLYNTEEQPYTEERDDKDKRK